MVFRKPYAFFIKNFRKFHILLIIMCGFIYSKTLQVSTFNKTFLTYLSYDDYFEPISKYLSPFLYIVTFITILIFLILLIVLKRKGKPWKLYLIPVLEYIALIIIFYTITNFYNTYKGDFTTTTIRALNNFLSIATFPQYLVFLILIMRTLGLDIKNFNFSADEEFLELDQDDREEFEISIDFDKNSIKRTLKKTQRSLGYFYEEHRYICNIIFIILTGIVFIRTYYYFGVSHKVLKENKSFNVNNYSMTINKSFYTDKDKAGNILEKNSAFVILNLSVQNNGASRVFDGNDFHIVNGNNNYTYQGNTYSNDFLDIGNSVPTGKLKNGMKKEFALVFKVDKNLNYKNFVLYYQEYKGNTSYLRKIKLNLENVSEIKNVKTSNITETLKIETAMEGKKEFSYETVSFQDNANYNIESCNVNNNCSIVTKNITAPTGSKILFVNFSSPDYEGTELMKFTTEYGKIKYMDNDGFYRELAVSDILLNKDYLGKKLYIKVPSNLENMKEISLIYTIRNKRYSYKIK